MGADGKFSDYYWGFVNKVAKEIIKSHPDKFIGAIAYGNYQTPPSKLKRLNPNVAIMISKWRLYYNDKAYHAKMDSYIEAWAQKTKNIYIWEYYLVTWGVLRGRPVFFPHTLSNDIQFLKRYSKASLSRLSHGRTKKSARWHFLV
jgi:hypothetical protein